MKLKCMKKFNSITDTPDCVLTILNELSDNANIKILSVTFYIANNFNVTGQQISKPQIFCLYEQTEK